MNKKEVPVRVPTITHTDSQAFSQAFCRLLSSTIVEIH